ncbi:MAG: hypothetical protein A3G75_13165 [Verrucomicrobia bacterium RIFCSPLOWO2_12_FULL_64_8]|nr:MAG: hypothetical protein A3G75_13165 [Verrucomicrobia bacterium RIFCSPLOWO2_12_FULL_64_8]
MQEPPPIANPPTRNWWQRNWKWFVPVGCLTALLLFVAFIGLVVAGAMGVMKSSDAYKEAVARARTEPVVVQKLGLPIEEGFLASGHVNTSGPSGEAELSIPLKGPKGKATLYVEAEKKAGRWQFKQLVVEFEATHERVELAAPAP